MGFDWIGHIFWLLQAASAVLLVFKAGEYDEVITALIFSPVILHKIVFGSGFFVLIPLSLGVMVFLSPWFLVALVAWQLLYAVCLGKAFDAGLALTLFLIFVPGISTIVLAFSNKHEYVGPVDILFFLRR